MSKKIIFLMFILVIMSVSFAEPLFYYKSGENITLKTKCRISGQPCPSTFNCNMSLIYPKNSTIVFQNQQMTYGNPFYSYNLGEYTTLGEYETNVVCNNGTKYIDGGYFFDPPFNKLHLSPRVPNHEAFNSEESPA